MNKSLLLLILTCMFELLWIFGFNVASLPWHWVLTGGGILIGFYVLSKTCEILPTGTVYAIFTSVGTIGAAVMDVYLIDGSFNIKKAFFMMLIILGVIILKLSDNISSKREQKEVA
jgi:paired small multidrug resistance pump